MATAAAEVDGGVVQRSSVKIQRCRYLAESGCTAMCVNLCKVGTLRLLRARGPHAGAALGGGRCAQGGLRSREARGQAL